MNEAMTSIEKSEVSKIIEDILSYKATMQNIFDDFGQSMAKIGSEDVFVGDASESLQERYNKLKQRFVDYTTTIDTFAENFTKAKESTQETENKLAAETANISDAH